MLLRKHFWTRVILLIVPLLGFVNGLHSFNKNMPILIISSYNPETSLTAGNIQMFQDICDSLGIKNPVVIENMNCKNLAEAKLWKERFMTIVSKYRNAEGDLDLSALMLLGQEAWASYLSLEVDVFGDLPVLVGMMSSNSLILPDDDDSLDTWNPRPLYLSNLYKRTNVISGVAYKYDIAENIKVARRFFPQLKRLALLTDNTFGGLVLQAHVKAEIEKENNLELIFLDGRVSDINTIIDQISKLDPSNTALLLGTWRVDKNESYFLSSILYTMMSANPKLPTFSLSTIGLGDWAIAGVVPEYRNQGKDLALKFKKILNNELSGCVFDFIPNRVRYDVKKVREFNLDETIMQGGILLNQDKTLIDRYPNLVGIIISVLSILGIAFMIVSYFLFKTRKLNISLTMSEDNNRLILNNIGVGLLFVDKNFEVRWENCSHIEEMAPWAFLRVGSKCHLSKDGFVAPCQDCPAVKFQDGKLLTKSELIERRENRVFSLTYIPVSNWGGEYMGFVLRIEDVTLKERTNIELQAAKEAAENADKLKSQFLANMSHEIRTPLNAIVGFSELLAGLDDPDEKQEFVKIIEANNKQLLQLINDILDLSKIEAGTLDFHMSQVDIVQVVDEVYHVFLPQCEAKGIELIKSVSCEDYWILSDKNRIAQVISNFMTNALKFTSKGHVHLGLEVREHDIKIYVKDTGMGISQEKRRAVFERFVKLNSFAQGTGLGLSICMMIVSRLGGTIDVESETGKGSTFWFTILKHEGGKIPVNEGGAVVL